MKVGSRKFVMGLLILAMSLTIISPMVYADGARSARIPVKINLTGAYPTNETYLVKMETDPEESSFPMPTDSEDGIYTLSIVGANSKDIPIEFPSSVGIYSYRIWQEKGKNSRGTYDDSEYKLKIYVTNKLDKNGKIVGLETTIVLYKDGELYKQGDVGEQKKHDTVAFTNYYRSQPTYPDDPDPDPDEDDDTEIEVEDDVDIDDDDDDTVIEVEDDVDIDDNLPKTGSKSTLAFTVIGLSLLALGIVVLPKKEEN